MNADQSRKSTMPANAGMPDESVTPGSSTTVGATDMASFATSATGAVVGVFADGVSAEQAVQQLKSAGFTEEQIGYASRHPGDNGVDAPTVAAAEADAGVQEEPAKDTLSAHLAGEHHGGTREGLVMGGVTGLAFGSIVGAAAALLLPGIGPVIAGGILGAALIGGAAGTVAGGIAGALRQWGFSHEDAEYYHREFEAGRTIVSVHADNRAREAASILQQYGAQRVSIAGDAGTTSAGAIDNASMTSS